MARKLKINILNSTSGNIEFVNTDVIDLSSSTGATIMPKGETSTEGTPSGRAIRFDTTENTFKDNDNSGEWNQIINKNSPYNSRKAFTSIDQIKGPTGFYSINILKDGNTPTFYIDQEYDGGGWVCVVANRRGTGGMRNTPYTQAVNDVLYRTGTTLAENTPADPATGSKDLADYNIWVGVKYWPVLGNRLNDGEITIVQYVSEEVVPLGDTESHTKRFRWKFNDFSNLYAMQGASIIEDETTTGTPGFYAYHAANGYNLTATDRDQDVYGANCSNLYGGHPWWFGACWSGNYWGSSTGSYQDAPFWNSSGGDHHNYGAVYIK